VKCIAVFLNYDIIYYITDTMQLILKLLYSVEDAMNVFFKRYLGLVVDCVAQKLEPGVGSFCHRQLKSRFKPSWQKQVSAGAFPKHI